MSVDTANAATQDLLRAFHGHELVYRADVSTPVLVGTGAAAAAPPEIVIRWPFTRSPSLKVDGHRVPHTQFSLVDDCLSWDFGSGPGRRTGRVEFTDAGLSGAGLVSTPHGAVSLSLRLEPPVYRCSLSADAGAHLSTGDDTLHLHSAGVDWDDATWGDGGLSVSYTTVPGDGSLGSPTTIVPTFTDTATGVAWTPQSPNATISSDNALVVTCYDSPPPDDRSGVPAAQAVYRTVLPTQLLAVFAADGQTFDGAMLVDDGLPQATVYAVRGVLAEPAAPRPALDVVSSRLAAVIPSPRAAPPGLVAAATAPVVPPGAPNVNDLAYLTPFSTTNNVTYVDVVQQATVADFYTILKYYMPEHLLQYASEIRPSLTGDLAYLAPFAAMPGVAKDGTQIGPATWYASLAVPFLVDALSRVGDPYSKFLNAERARTWMSRTVAVSPVYNTQVPAIYAYHFARLNPAITAFLTDQVTNNASYAPQIEADAAAWKQQLVASLTNPAPSDLLAFTDVVDKLSALGAQSHYWAYVVFRHATNPTTLDQLRQLGMTQPKVTMRFGMEVQRVCALLSVLDPSGTFTAEYAKVIALVQVTNTLPQLIDYGGQAAAYKDVVHRILAELVTQYADSPDDELRQAIKDLNDAIDAGWTVTLVDSFLGVVAGISGAYDWRKLTTYLEASGWRKTGNVPGFVADAVASAFAVAGLVMFIYGLKRWDDLGEIDQVNLVSSAVQVVVNFAMSMIKQGAAISEIYRVSATWSDLSVLLNPLKSNVEEATKTALGGSMKFLLGQTEADLRPDIPLADLTDAVEDARELVDTRRLNGLERALGSNIDEVAIRVGWVFAVVNLVLTALTLSTVTDPLDIADNTFFLASSVIELIGFTAGWVAGAYTAAALSATVAAFVSACSAIGAVLAVIGLIILIVALFIHRQTPVEEFALGEATAAGYYMPLGYAIESLRPWAPPAPAPSLVAVTLASTPSSTVVLRAGADGSAGFGPPDGTAATGLGLTLDGSGLATLTALVVDGTGALRPLALARTSTGVAFLPAVTVLGTDPAPADTRAAQAARAWTVTLLAAPTVADTRRDDGTYPVLSASFSLSDPAAPGSYLDLSGATPTLTTSAGAPVPVTVRLVTQLPQGLTMHDLTLTTADRDRASVARLDSSGSTPLTWSLTPAPGSPPLPAFLVAEGAAVRQVLGQAPPITAAAQYTLTCTNPVGSTSTTFTIAVTAAPPPTPPPAPSPTAPPAASPAAPGTGAAGA